jgi:hypothetical protein
MKDEARTTIEPQRHLSGEATTNIETIRTLGVSKDKTIRNPQSGRISGRGEKGLNKETRKPGNKEEEGESGGGPGQWY